MERQLSDHVEIEKKLGQIRSLQRLQEDAMRCRECGPFLRKIAKQTCIAEITKLQNFEITYDEKELKLLTPEQWPKCEEIELPALDDVEAMLKDIECTEQALKMFD